MTRKINIALAGNPNSGKSTLFNQLTGLHQKISNYPGTTVDVHTGVRTWKEQYEMHITDLPGFYSLYPKSEDERVAVHEMMSNAFERKFDVIIYVADASNLRRSLMLFSQIVDLKEPVILALNMTDLAANLGIQVDTRKLEEVLGVPVVEIVARKGKGIDTLLDKIVQQPTEPSFTFHPSSFYQNSVALKIGEISGVKKVYTNILMAHNAAFFPTFNEGILQIIQEEQVDLIALQSNDSLHRFKVIDELLAFCVKRTTKEANADFSNKLDKLLTHRVWGYLIFLIVFFLIFQAIFSIAAYPMDWVEGAFNKLIALLENALPDNLAASFLLDGLLPGFQGVVVFVPQIAILFGLLTILEDSGYMARVSFIMDKLLRKFGLNGKSVVPLIGGMACAVGSIMAARTIENRKERLLTILVTPLMSCSARLPVYILLIGMIAEPKRILGIFNVQGLMLFGMYLLGVFSSLLVAFIASYFVKSDKKNYFIMEMPVYRSIVWKNVLSNMWNKSKVFVLSAGKIIVIVSVILWMMGSFAPGNAFSTIEARYEHTDMTSDEKASAIASEKLEASYLGILGKSIEPVIRPLGYDWKIGIGLISSLAAREVFVGTMNTIYSISDDDNTIGLREKMQKDIHPITGKPIYSPIVALSLLLFYAFALQCVSTIAIVKKETGGWTWPIIQLVLLTGLAYFSSLVVYQVFK